MELIQALQSFLDLVKEIGGDARELRVDPPATEDEIKRVEENLRRPIPTHLRDAMLGISAHLEFRWFLNDSLDLPEPLREIFCGENRRSEQALAADADKPRRPRAALAIMKSHLKTLPLIVILMIAGCSRQTNLPEDMTMSKQPEDIAAIRQLAADWLSGDPEALLALLMDEPVDHTVDLDR